MRLLILLIGLFFSGICRPQNLGIGTTTPLARLDIKGESTSSLNNTLILRNSSNDTLFRMRNDGRLTIGYNGLSAGRTINIGGNGLNLYKSDVVFSGALFPTDTSIVLWSQVGDTNYVILQPSWGKVGVGTFGPKAKFHVKGDFLLGEEGTILNSIIKITIPRNLATIQPTATLTESFAVAGAAIGSTVYISPDQQLPDGLIIAYARVSAANTVEVKFTNTLAVSLNAASMSYHITVIH